MTTKMHDLHAKIVEKIDAYNEALKNKDLAKMVALEEELKEAESEYASEKCEQVYSELRKTENPVKSALEMLTFDVSAHKRVTEDGVVKGFELIDDKKQVIDIKDFCKRAKLDTDWYTMVEKFSQLLAVRMATNLNLPADKIKTLSDSYYMSDLARKVKMGETPQSNTQICKMMQSIIDKILFEDNGNGKNKYLANTHDVTYLLAGYAKISNKDVLTVRVAKASVVLRLITAAMHRIVTGKTYDVEYKAMKGNNVAVTVEAPAEVSVAKKSEKKAEKKSPAKKTTTKKSEAKVEITEAPVETVETVVVKKSA